MDNKKGEKSILATKLTRIEKLAQLKQKAITKAKEARLLAKQRRFDSLRAFSDKKEKSKQSAMLISKQDLTNRYNLDKIYKRQESNRQAPIMLIYYDAHNGGFRVMIGKKKDYDRLNIQEEDYTSQEKPFSLTQTVAKVHQWAGYWASKPYSVYYPPPARPYLAPKLVGFPPVKEARVEAIKGKPLPNRVKRVTIFDSHDFMTKVFVHRKPKIVSSPNNKNLPTLVYRIPSIIDNSVLCAVFWKLIKAEDVHLNYKNLTVSVRHSSTGILDSLFNQGVLRLVIQPYSGQLIEMVLTPQNRYYPKQTVNINIIK